MPKSVTISDIYQTIILVFHVHGAIYIQVNINAFSWIYMYYGDDLNEKTKIIKMMIIPI
jgi:hypothetical protein